MMMTIMIAMMMMIKLFLHTHVVPIMELFGGIMVLTLNSIHLKGGWP